MTSTLNSELKPCQFCGGTDAFVERLDYSAAYVQCDSAIDEHCAYLARGPVGVQDDDGEEIPGAAAAIRAWNQRALSPAAPNEPAQALPELPDLIAVGALRQFQHNDGSEGFVFAYDKTIVDREMARLDAAIASCRDLPAKDAALPRRPKAHSISGKDLNSLHVLYTSGQMDAYGKECFEAGAAAEGEC